MDTPCKANGGGDSGGATGDGDGAGGEAGGGAGGGPTGEGGGCFCEGDRRATEKRNGVNGQ